jgi:hypothetical protein
MFCYKNPVKQMTVLHFVESILYEFDDTEIVKCLCGREFIKGDVILFKNRPHKNIEDCMMCCDNLERFWRKTIRKEFS